jgi:hypothetical protein
MRTLRGAQEDARAIERNAAIQDGGHGRIPARWETIYASATSEIASRMMSTTTVAAVTMGV